MLSESIEELMQKKEGEAEGDISETGHESLCVNCSIKQERIEKLQKLRSKQRKRNLKLRKENINLRKLVEYLRKDLSSEESSTDEAEHETCEDIGILDEACHFDDELMGNSSDDDLREETKDPDWNANMEDEEANASDDDELGETEDKNTSANMRSADSEPKFIVFYSVLVSLFSLFCFECKAQSPSVNVKMHGSMTIVEQTCKSCKGYSYVEESTIGPGKVSCW
ncbi:uncharacterized protein LOC114525089 [Dendronephthya gigantea]|uniref:uncharacterized protein LOC114525089 n=1 Tax=Dendronephthya gigantea TaxID=151771 RepID=UPI00106B21E9|nr:uncharacterized protein LOC114525089 [Dendronephthya gigantea]